MYEWPSAPSRSAALISLDGGPGSAVFPDVVRASKRERLDRGARVHAGARGHAAAVGDEEVGHVVCAVEAVRDRRSRIVSHPRGSKQVPSPDGCKAEIADAFRARSLEHLVGVRDHVAAQPAAVLVQLVMGEYAGHAETRQVSPIEVDPIRLLR